MTISIICFNKLSPEYKKIFDDFYNKIIFNCNLEIIELKEQNEKNLIIKKEKETKEILKFLNKDDKNVFLLSIFGKKINSFEFSNILLNVKNNYKKIFFIIGGSNGIDENIFKNKISFSDLTFPYQLFRIILLEQIYRGFSIINNSNYHK